MASVVAQKKIVILGTGGTIAGTAESARAHTAYSAARIGIQQLVDALPDPRSSLLEIVTEQVAQIDSKDMSFEVWIELAVRTAHFLSQSDVQAIVITHGTDTLEESAYFLHAFLRPEKPVVLTCAMRPATSLAADGPQNLLDAIAVAAEPCAAGVIVVCAGAMHSAEDVQKRHPYRLDAFSSGDAGVLGYVEDGRLRLLRNWPAAQIFGEQFAIKKLASLPDPGDWPWVEIVLSHAGASGASVEALAARGVRGIVVAGTGNGTIHSALEAALLKAQACGVQVVVATRCPDGRAGSNTIGAFPDSKGLSPVKARIALMLSLMADVSGA